MNIDIDSPKKAAKGTGGVKRIFIKKKEWKEASGVEKPLIVEWWVG